MAHTDPARATYLYCVVESPSPPSLARGPRGLPGAGPARTLDAGRGVWIIAADAPLAKYGEAAIARGLRDLRWVSACAAAHEAVVEHAGRSGAVIPMRLFTLFADDERALAHLRSGRRRLERLLERTRGRQEWGVRLSLDGTRTRALLRARVGAAGDRARDGTAFLRRKQRQRDASRDLTETAIREANRAFVELERRADDVRRRTPPAGGSVRILLDAAFLVPAARVAAFRSAARALGRRLASHGCALTLTGPWPPYNFVEDTTT